MYRLSVHPVVTAGIDAARWLRDATYGLQPKGPVAVTYHPLTYAWAPHKAYLERYGEGRKKALLIGMNPGPWGMGQNGIPFGERVFAGEWLGLEGIPVGKPEVEHPKRPVLGWANKRSEESGKRLWGFLRDTYGAPEKALKDLLVVNHCPLLMFGETGTNITPDKLLKADREQVAMICDEGLLRMIDAFEPQTLIGVGKYAEGCCTRIAEERDIEVTHILHPSPASPLANRENGAYWRKKTTEVFQDVGLL